jgi:tetratricopeptide (TPR) repeat protein
MDSLDQSYKHFNAACRMAPQYANAYYNRAYVSELLGKYQDAMNDYRQAMSLNPEHTSANEGLERVKKTIKDT